MLKKILSNTALFGIIIIFVKVFEVIFGSKNSLVGVTIIIATLVLMQEDLTEKLIENFIKIISINLVLGIFAHISSYNMWEGLILNFVALAAIGYLLSLNLNKVMIVPFGLQYLFMLYTPVTGGDFAKRLLGLSFGALLIMVVQLFIHKKNNNIRVEESNLIECDKRQVIYRCAELFKKDIINTVRGAYAFRIGLITALAAFTVEFFHLQQGRWIVYTIFSLTELYSENCKRRSKQRLQGTIIGVFIIIALFMFIKNNTIRSLIVLIGGYLDSYTTNYRDKMICVTMSVVASVSLINGTFITAFERVGYVFIGILFAVIADKLIFTKKLAEFDLAA
ncbi:FUSC family protein [Clostridium swellfunianum]|uniref:FUSC family protein n=1 Tax=Clostridium swellfunianum TaxID=1367462 RepID=UPI00202EB84E|nr:FUSC family protein [Clostridium swellfunianum]MCM0650515.1 FUSC family protein [Clostridium swellfunianum]